MFHSVVAAHKIYCYITLHPGQDYFSLLFAFVSAPGLRFHLLAIMFDQKIWEERMLI